MGDKEHEHLNDARKATNSTILQALSISRACIPCTTAGNNSTTSSETFYIGTKNNMQPKMIWTISLKASSTYINFKLHANTNQYSARNTNINPEKKPQAPNKTPHFK